MASALRVVGIAAVVLAMCAGLAALPAEAQRRRRPSPVPTLRMGVDVGAGGWDQAAPVDHAVGSIGVPLDVAITQWLWIGAQARYLVGGDAGRDADGDGFDDEDAANPKAFVLTGGPRLVLHTEPARREAWRFGLAGGWLLAIDGGDDGPVLEVAVERQAGTLLVDGPDAGHGRGQDVTLGVRAQQGLGDASDFRALLVTAGYAMELFVPLPEGGRPRRTRPDVEYTLHGELLLGTGFGRGGFAYGAGVSAGLPLGRLFEPRARGQLLRVDGTDQREGASAFSALAGIRLSRWYLPWLEVLAGYTHVLGTDPTAFASGPVLEVAGGLQFPDAFGCGLGLVVGQRGQIGLGEGDRNVGTLLVTLGVSHDNLIRAAECFP